MTAQRADLATFAFEHNDGHTWRELMDLWNRDKPQAGRFHDARTFAKACREAFLSVTGEALEWQGARHRADG